jgi:putative transposase
VRTVRAECLDWILVLGRRHVDRVLRAYVDRVLRAYVDRVLRAYVDHYNRARPHRGLDLSTPESRPAGSDANTGGKRVVRRSILGGLINEYDVAA